MYPSCPQAFQPNRQPAMGFRPRPQRWGFDIIGQAVPTPLGTPPVAAPAPVVIQNTPVPARDVQVNVAESNPTFLQAIPQLLVVGVVTGAAFAVGSGLVGRFVFGRR